MRFSARLLLTTCVAICVLCMPSCGEPSQATDETYSSDEATAMSEAGLFQVEKAIASPAVSFRDPDNEMSYFRPRKNADGMVVDRVVAASVQEAIVRENNGELHLEVQTEHFYDDGTSRIALDWPTLIMEKRGTSGSSSMSTCRYSKECIRPI